MGEHFFNSRAPKLPLPILNIYSAVPSSSSIVASTEGVPPVGQPGHTGLATAGLAYRQTLRGYRQLMAYIKLSKKSHGQMSGKLQKELQLLLINFIRIKVITGYTFTFHSSRSVDIEVKVTVFVIQVYERGSVA